MSKADIKSILEESKTVAVVGLSPRGSGTATALPSTSFSVKATVSSPLTLMPTKYWVSAATPIWPPSLNPLTSWISSAAPGSAGDCRGGHQGGG
jgi:hypothetical protein